MSSEASRKSARVLKAIPVYPLSGSLTEISRKTGLTREAVLSEIIKLSVRPGVMICEDDIPGKGTTYSLLRNDRSKGLGRDFYVDRY